MTQRYCNCGDVFACHLCRFYARHPDFVAAPTGPAVSPRPPSADCVHLGRIALWPEKPDVFRDWRSCDRGHGIVCACQQCKTCPDYAAETETHTEPTMSSELNAVSWPVRFDERNLSPGKPGKRFNSSIIDWQGEYLLAYRDGWSGSEIHLIRLDRSFQPKGESVKLDLMHWQDANYGREDPRLFMFCGKLHIAYAGVVGGDQIHHTNVLYARISDGLAVEQVFSPKYPSRNPWEKNWSFFECNGELFCSYSVTPHKVLKIEGERASLAHQTSTPAPWSGGGEIRGGSSPLLVGDVFYCFFHSSTEMNGHRVYRMGLYTMEAKPPFRVLSIVPDAILWADQGSKPHDQYASVIFPCGAVLVDGHFVVSCGIHDRTTSLEVFNKQHLDDRLFCFAPRKGLRFRENTDDLGVWSWCHAQDEYRLREVDLTGQVVVDVGGHIGSFSLLAAKKGAKRVHCYEPGPENLEYLRHNATLEPGIVVEERAVWSHDCRLSYTPGGDTYHSAHGIVRPDDGGPITAVGIDNVIVAAASLTGRVALMKFDCEHAEATIFPAATRFDLVDRVVGEYHSPFCRGVVEAVLKNFGFAVEIVPGGHPDTGLFFGRKP